LGSLQRIRSLRHRVGVGSDLENELREAGETALEPSIEVLYRDRREPMVRLAYLLTGSEAVAEDLVQDSFLEVHRHDTSVQNPSAYLRATVVNACRAHHRHRSVERAHFADLLRDDLSPETPVVLDALAKLPYRQRAALALRYYEDLPEREIAGLLRCRPATVRSLVHRGLAELRKVMEQ
jgi:RNA polymerase sigma factor (sigma-70 family)